VLQQQTFTLHDGVHGSPVPVQRVDLNYRQEVQQVPWPAASEAPASGHSLQAPCAAFVSTPASDAPADALFSFCEGYDSEATTEPIIIPKSDEDDDNDECAGESRHPLE
jgi:hypothetical protein